MSAGGGFRALWTGTATANLGDGVAFVAIPLLAASLTSDPLRVAALAAAYSAARLLVVLPVGVYVDRWERRTLLWTASLARGCVLVLLGGLFAAGLGSLPLLYVAFVALGALETVTDNAAPAVLPSVVPPDRLEHANGRISAAQLVADEFVGPPLGGVLFGVAAAVPLLVTGGLYAAAASAFLALPGSSGRGARSGTGLGRPSVLHEAREGVVWLCGHRLLGVLAVVGGIASVAYMMPFSVLVLYARDLLGLGPTGYGLLLAGSALGGLAGSFAAAPLRARIGQGPTIVASLLLGAATMLGLAVVRDPVLAGVLLAAYILHAVVWGVCVGSVRQRLVPEHLRGRVHASSTVLGLLGLAGGAALGGVLGSLDLSIPFLVSGVLFVVGAVLVTRVVRDP